MGTETESCSQRVGSVWMLLDRNGETARRFNARWLPRAYALDEQGNVTYAQPETTLDPQAPLQVAALWESGIRQVTGESASSVAPPLPGPLSPTVLLAGSPPSLGASIPAMKGGKR
jgi:hypothetical protein